MAKFAVYYIPPADNDLYRQGSEILGYDVRAGIMLPENNPTRAKLPEFDPEWIVQPQTYGFHVTTGYSLYFDMGDLPLVECEMENVVNCFGRDLGFYLTPTAERIADWQNILALRYEPNPAMLMLHTMLIARVNPLGTGSNVSQAYARHDPSTLDPVKRHRVQQYYTPYILDGWAPHFTLMMPYPGEKLGAMRETLLSMFNPEPIRVSSICLLVRDDQETHYRLHREFFLNN